MNKVYSFAIKLQDLFSPTMLRVANVYEKQVGVMERASARVKGMMSGATQKVGELKANLGGLNARFSPRVDSSDIDKADRKAGGLMSKLKGLMGGGALMGGLIGGGMAGMAMGAAEMAIESIGQINEMTIGAAQRNESMMFNMNELMGKQVAEGVVKAIDAYAPEKRTALIDSAQQLAGAGVAPEKIMDTLTALNNVSAITGKSVEELANIQAVIKSTGYVQGDEIGRFKERGINLNPYIAQILKISEDGVAKAQANGLITYDVFDKAMQAYAGKGGRFDGVYERKRDSTSGGREAALSGKWAVTLADLGAKFLPLKVTILDLLSKLIDVAGPVFTFLAGLFEKIWHAIKPVWDGMVGLIGYFGDLMTSGSALGGVLGYLGTVLDVILWGVNMVATAIGWLIDSALTKLIIGIWAAVKAWGAFNFVMNMNPILRIITLVIALVSAVMYAWKTFDGFREGVLRSWEMIKSVFANVGSFLLALLTGDIAGAVAIVGAAVSGGLAGGDSAVRADRLEKLSDRRARRRGLGDAAGATAPGAAGGGSLGDAAGLSSTVGNSKSNSIVINIGSLIAKSEISVMDLKEGIDDIESKLIDALLRVANSGARVVQA